MNNLGRRLADRECNERQREVAESCNEQPCPKWSPSEWSEVGTPVTASRCELAGASRLTKCFIQPPRPCGRRLPRAVPGDLWEGGPAQTSVLLGQHGGEAQRSLLRPFPQTPHGGELRAARVCILEGRRLGRGEAEKRDSVCECVCGCKDIHTMSVIAKVQI